MDDSSLKTSVLIVDDSSLNIRVVSNIISPLGVSIHTAKNGVHALNFLASHKPSVILMDIRMPNMDGFECCSRIKSTIGRAQIPIIFISGSHDIRDQQKAMDIGALAYLTKPINPEKLIDEITQSTALV